MRRTAQRREGNTKQDGRHAVRITAPAPTTTHHPLGRGEQAAAAEHAPDLRGRVAAQVRATIANPDADFDIAGISDDLVMTYGPDVDVSALPEDR